MVDQQRVSGLLSGGETRFNGYLVKKREEHLYRKEIKFSVFFSVKSFHKKKVPAKEQLAMFE